MNFRVPTVSCSATEASFGSGFLDTARRDRDTSATAATIAATTTPTTRNERLVSETADSPSMQYDGRGPLGVPKPQPSSCARSKAAPAHTAAAKIVIVATATADTAHRIDRPPDSAARINPQIDAAKRAAPASHAWSSDGGEDSGRWATTMTAIATATTKPPTRLRAHPHPVRRSSRTTATVGAAGRHRLATSCA